MKATLTLLRANEKGEGPTEWPNGSFPLVYPNQVTYPDQPLAVQSTGHFEFFDDLKVHVPKLERASTLSVTRLLKEEPFNPVFEEDTVPVHVLKTAPLNRDPNAKKKILIAIHGLNESNQIFRTLGAVASGEFDYEMYSITLPGFGQEYDDGYWPSTDRTLSFVYQYIDHVRKGNPDAEISLCGESLGAALINMLAPVLASKVIKRVFLFAPAVCSSLFSYVCQFIMAFFIKGYRRADQSVFAEQKADENNQKVKIRPRFLFGPQSLIHLMKNHQTVGFKKETPVTIIAGKKDATVSFSDITNFWNNRYAHHAHANLIPVEGGNHAMTRGAFAVDTIRHALASEPNHTTTSFNPLAQHEFHLLEQQGKLKLLDLYWKAGGSLRQCFIMLCLQTQQQALETLIQRAAQNPYGASYCTLFSTDLKTPQPQLKPTTAEPFDYKPSANS